MYLRFKKATQVSLATMLALLAFLSVSLAQTATPPMPVNQPPTVPAPPTRVDPSLRCEDSKSVALAREESRNRQALQRLDYTSQRNAEMIQRARFSCSHRALNYQAACEAGAAGRERRYAEQLDVTRAREDAYHTEALRRIEANTEVCKSRYGGSSLPLTPVEPLPPPPATDPAAAPNAATPASPNAGATSSGPLQKTTQLVIKGQQVAGALKDILGAFGKKK